MNGLYMANAEQEKILRQGNVAWNKWRDENDEIKPDLRSAYLLGANLSGANLRKADLSQANLSHANLTVADLSGASLNSADLSGANLSRSNLRDADLRGANLIGANLINANLIKANFGQTQLAVADFSGANLSKADLNKANLLKAKLIETNLSRAYLGGAILSKANLSGANLNKANLSGADLNRANLNRADLSGANLIMANLGNSILTRSILTEANLIRASFVETNLEGADLSFSSVYGISAWNLKTNRDTKQKGLVITNPGEPAIYVDNIEIAQLIYLLLKHENLRQVLSSVTKRGVLILGRFGGGGIEVLRSVAEKLREMKYLPIIFEFDRLRDRTYTETIKTLAGLSRFVVVDLSGPSVPQELYATVPHFKIPYIPILEKGKQPYTMFADILEYDWVIKPIVEFDTTESLIDSIPSEIVKPAEKHLKKRQKLLLELFGD